MFLYMIAKERKQKEMEEKEKRKETRQILSQ